MNLSSGRVSVFSSGQNAMMILILFTLAISKRMENKSLFLFAVRNFFHNWQEIFAHKFAR